LVILISYNLANQQIVALYVFHTGCTELICSQIMSAYLHETHMTQTMIRELHRKKDEHKNLASQNEKDQTMESETLT